MKNIEREFKIKLFQPKLEIGIDIEYRGIKGKVISLTGKWQGKENKDFVIIELEKTDELGSKIIEIRKDSFDFLTYAR
ncbi:MAG: hypothetical protein DRJ01_09715 [Bacteroidetes bacterium]|nr:MAG: hypothetical protein DRJ01_09715 [Bacteroidota bacterium]